MNSTTLRARILTALVLVTGSLSVGFAAESATAAPEYSVSLNASTARPDVGRSVRLTGKVSPSAAGKRVKVQGKAAGTGWVTIKRVVLSKKSTYRTSVRFPRAGRVALRVVKAASGNTRRGVSRLRNLRVGGGAAAPVISTNTLPRGVVGSPYSAIIGVADDRAGRFAALDLPPGLAINDRTGQIGGTPTTPGTTSVRVFFRDAKGRTTSKRFSIRIDAQSGTPVISTTTLPAGTVTYAYNATLETVGNRAGTWAVASGTLPAGLSLNNSTGAISGKPTAPGTSTFTVLFTAVGGQSDSKTLQIVIGTAAQPVISTTSLPAVTVLTPYSATLQTVSDKVGTWSVFTGSLPPGLTLNGATGVISGTPTAVGTAGFSVRFVQTNSGLQDTQALSIQVEPNTPPIIAASTPPTGTVAEPYTLTLQTVGNRSGTWAILSGALPAGLSLNGKTGVISGTPTTAGKSTFTVIFTGINSQSDSRQFSITVGPAAAPVITTSSLPNGVAFNAYSATLKTAAPQSGTWSIAAGTLPNGLVLNAATGVISGTLTLTAVGSHAFTVRFTTAGGVATKNLSITVTAV